jgi:tRNA(Ile)-lysidine synthase
LAIDQGLEKTALSTIDRYRMLEGARTVVAAVSGGPDSVALLLFLHGLAPRLRFDLHVFHLDHMLRGQESARDARFVEELARELGLPVRSLAVDVRGEAGLAGRSPQDAAREIRLDRLLGFADEVAADRIATGHTADDQVETFLMRAIQGAGLSGLGGIPPVRGRFVRPLIEVWRFQVEEYCDAMGVTPRQDMSNLSISYLRNRVRLSLLPFLASEFGASVKEVVLREVESLALDGDYMKEQAARAFELARDGKGEEVRLEIPCLLSLHPALQRGVIREAWSRVAPGEQSLSWRHVLDLLEKVAGGGTGARLDLPGGRVAEREYDLLVFRPGETDTPYPPSSLAVPGVVSLPWAGVTIEARLVGREAVRFSADPEVEFVCPELEPSLEVRAPAPGDRFRPLGSGGSKKLKDFFIDLRLPRAVRKRCPVVLSGGDVVWVAGHRIDERFRLPDAAEEAVMLIMRPLDDYDLTGAPAQEPGAEDPSGPTEAGRDQGGG